MKWNNCDRSEFSISGESLNHASKEEWRMVRVIDVYRTHDICHVIVVSHGVTVRAFTMGWMRYSPEWLDTERNPGNCWIRHIRRLSTATCGS